MMTFKNILQIYALLACLIAGFILLIYSAMTLNALTDLAFPQYKRYSALAKYTSPEKFLFAKKELEGFSSKKYEELKKLSQEELIATINRERESLIEETEKRSIERLIDYVQWILACSIFFFLHWRLYKRSIA